jgi:hypothetical protein
LALNGRAYQRPGGEAKGGGSGSESREPKQPSIMRPSSLYEPDLHIDTLVKAQNFR